MRPATALVSGGKDSIYSAYLAECQGWSVDQLLTIAPADPESMMFHTPHVDLVGRQAEAWGRAWRKVTLHEKGESAEGEALERALSEAPGEWIVAGAIASSYQYRRLLRVADRLGRKVYAPLWGKDGLRVVREEVGAGLDIRFVHLAAEGLPPEWVGRRLDAEMIEAIAARSASPRAFHPAGEGGEYETLVVDAPFFRARLRLEGTSVRRTAGTATLAFTAARLEPKPGPGTPPAP